MATATRAAGLDAIEADALGRLEALYEQRARLSLDVLGSDPEVTAELESVESEIDAAETALARVKLARDEHARRQQAQAAAEAAGAQQAALNEARALQADRQRAARAVDSAARKFAVAVKDWQRAASDQTLALRRAGRDPSVAQPRTYLVELALAHALDAAGLPRGFVRLEVLGRMSHRHIKPMTEADPVAIEPKERGSDG